MRAAETAHPWQEAEPYLVRYASSGEYFARVRVHGKLHRQRSDTTDKSQALLKLAEYLMPAEGATKTNRVVGRIESDARRPGQSCDTPPDFNGPKPPTVPGECLPN